MPPRVRAHPFLTLLAVVSAILIVVGRINRALWWGDWVFVGGIAVLVIAGALFVLLTRKRSKNAAAQTGRISDKSAGR